MGGRARLAFLAFCCVNWVLPAFGTVVDPCDPAPGLYNPDACFERSSAEIRVISKRRLRASQARIKIAQGLLVTAHSAAVIAEAERVIAEETRKIETDKKVEEDAIDRQFQKIFKFGGFGTRLDLECDGQSPVAGFGDGASCELSFRLLDADTGQPIADGSIRSVVYEANLDPDLPDLFVPVGISSDAGSGFALAYTVDGFEPLVRATPLEAAGDALSFVGPGGAPVSFGSDVFIDAVAIPEPGAAAVFGFGLAVVAFQRRTSGRKP